ncbi:MAG TPA: TauD/TfdA family dioxygenase [Longimicrobiaceae bacterium]|nr:TauD/TfdA family dioxygenase [Longimicrobiaceae bacterium]
MKRTGTPANARSWSDRIKKVQPISVSQTQLVRIGHLPGHEGLPLVVEPNPEYGTLLLHEWARDHLDFIEKNVLEYGGVLFRNWGTPTQEDFHRVLDAIGTSLIQYTESSTPRTNLKKNIYTSTEFPQDQTIALHNELSTAATFPMKIWFFCDVPAEEGGQTPIADVRRVYQRLSPETRERFAEKGWMLVRNYGDGFGLTWQDSFHTDDRAEVERYCRENAVEWEWKEGDRLRTRQVRPAIAEHPGTGEKVWFNHIAFWHDSSLDPQVRQLLREEFEPEDMPYQTFYGDGTTIEDEVAAELREAYLQERVVFDWQKGDLLMMNNMLAAHGRMPYRGERKTLVAMAEPYTRPDLHDIPALRAAKA